MLLRLAPENTKINFLGGRFIALAVSAMLMVASIGLFFMKDLNYGIDFKGGMSVAIELSHEVDLTELRGILGDLNLGDTSVKEFGAPEKAMIGIELQAGGSEAQNETIDLVKSTLSAQYPDIIYLSSGAIGSTVSGELKSDGAWAVSLAVLAVLLYIWIRFEWQFGLGAVIALVHDVVLTIGFFSITQLEFNLSIIAALLTIVGYSLNDTVVVYDRVRENIRRYNKLDMKEVLNLSLNQTLSRTLMTSVTTLIALVSLYVFGGEVIKGFTLAMIWGVVVGTYSSVFIASPMLLFFKIQRDAMLLQTDNKN